MTMVDIIVEEVVVITVEGVVDIVAEGVMAVEEALVDTEVAERELHFFISNGLFSFT